MKNKIRLVKYLYQGTYTAAIGKSEGTHIRALWEGGGLQNSLVINELQCCLLHFFAHEGGDTDICDAFGYGAIDGKRQFGVARWVGADTEYRARVGVG